MLDDYPRGPGSDLLTHLMSESVALFADHPVNVARRAAGKPPATNVWLWGLGSTPQLTPFAELYGKQGAMITAVDLLRGLAALIGWRRIEVPGATGYLDTDYAAKGRYAVEALKDVDLVCVHVEATDEASHEGNAAAKIKALEEIDRHIVGPLHEALKKYGDYRILVTPDHPTPLRTKTHSHGYVPFALAGSGIAPDAAATLRRPDGRPLVAGVRRRLAADGVFLGEVIRPTITQLCEPIMGRDVPSEMVLPRKFVRMCRRNLRRPKVADSSGVELSGAGLLTGTLVFRRILRREVLAADEQYIGILLPPSAGSVLANMALTIDRRIAVNLNYTVSAEVMNDCIAQCGIRHVLTSPRVLERFPLKIDANLVYVEDLRRKVTLADKLIAAAQAWLLPSAVLERRLGLAAIAPDDVLTIMFTSGSTGQPKGVMLTHRNVSSNVEAIDHILRLRSDDVLLGVLPMFHSFGYTTNLWTVMAMDPKGVYHYTPLEARQVGKLCRQHGATILLSTPTFLRTYLRRCEAEELATLNTIFTGAEKLPADLADAFEKKFGVRPVEGYGTTELSPVVSGNIPPSRDSTGGSQGAREGTIGRPLPGIRAKVIDLETGEDLPPGRQGMLLVTGPNVMKGYLHRPDLTAEVMRDGWYVTGDMATIDGDGFIHITGRVHRFSKMGGEMVPHILIEEAINRIVGIEEDGIHLAVTAVPDEKKGERLVVLHTGLPVPSEEICRRLVEQGLPPLWVPSPDSFRQVEAIPVLGTGKLDLKRLKEAAMEEFSTPKV